MTPQSYHEFFDETLKSSSFKEYDDAQQVYLNFDNKLSTFLASSTFWCCFGLGSVYLINKFIQGSNYSLFDLLISSLFCGIISAVAAFIVFCFTMIFCTHTQFLYKIMPGFSKKLKVYELLKLKMINTLQKPKFQHVILIKLEQIIDEMSLPEKNRSESVKKQLNEFHRRLKESFINEDFESSLSQFTYLSHYLKSLSIDFSYKEKFISFEEQQQIYKDAFGIKPSLLKEEDLKEFNSFKKHL